VRIAVVGKYVSLLDAYLSVKEALNHAGLAHGRHVEIEWINAEELETGNPEVFLGRAHGIVVPGGFGARGIEGKIAAAHYARTHNVPYLGLCLGMQVMVIELGRTVYGPGQAHSSEFDPETPHPVIDILPEQRDLADKGGTMRLGNWACILQAGTKAADLYGVPVIYERHRHRYEFNNAYRRSLTEAGLVIAGLSPDSRLVEISEIRDHPFMIGCQFHPELKSRPTRPHPLFLGFIAAAVVRAQLEGETVPSRRMVA